VTAADEPRDAAAAYFERIGDTAFRATAHVGGAWNVDDQHIAPALGLLAHVVERDRDRRGRGRLAVSRLSYDILGTIPVDVVDTDVTVVRGGRTIELVEATLVHDARVAVRLRAWLLQPHDTAALAGTGLPAIPCPDEMAPWDPTTVWPGGFIASAQVRRQQAGPGRAAFWVRTPVPLVRDEPVSDLARMAGLVDIANGMTVRVDPRRVAFPNVDLTLHLFRQPRGEWVGFDTTVSFGADGVGLTSSVLHDTDGPVGTMAQILTVRP
jgi:hypothetical protein